MWQKAFGLAMFATLLSLAMTTTNAGGEKKSPPSFEPEVAIQNENYREVIKQWQIRKGIPHLSWSILQDEDNVAKWTTQVLLQEEYKE